MNTEEIVDYVSSRNRARTRFAPIQSQVEIELEEALVDLTKAAKIATRTFYTSVVVVVFCTALFVVSTYFSL